MVQDAVPETGGIATPYGPVSGEEGSSEIELPFDFEQFLRSKTANARKKQQLSEEDFYNLGDKDEAELYRLGLDLKSQSDEIKARHAYGKYIFWLIVAWLFLVLFTVWASAVNFTAPSWYPSWLPIISEFTISDTVLGVLLGTTTANIIGLLLVVVRYLFPNRGGN